MDITKLDYDRYSDETVRIEPETYSQLKELHEDLECNDNLSVRLLIGHKVNGGNWTYQMDILRYDESPLMMAKDTDSWFDVIGNEDVYDQIKQGLSGDFEREKDEIEGLIELADEMHSEIECMDLGNHEKARIFYDLSRGVDYVVTEESVGYYYDTHSYKLILEIEYNLDFDEINEYINEIGFQPNELVTIWINANHELKVTRGSHDKEMVELISLRFEEVPDEIEISEHDIELEKDELTTKIIESL